ncbi:low-density lipoprotein receptor-related protein 4-like [Strongylocentrotus purpuratus]|uniref:Uncharacterized protein n=1 Tax=Strongylocentrotus purpuratus TaxID=7668 RepID=A0A7M7NYQ8_STRPU|nr:low-density lipoprotein receptor-related protein 4-like [Strongylocentrotus purpuratus]
MEGLNILRICWMIFILQGLPLKVLSATSIGGLPTERIVLVSTTTGIYLSRGPDFDFNQLPISVGSPGGLDFDEEIGMLFWTDYSNNAIKRAELDDTSSTFVIATGTSPAAIAIDGNENLIFWVDTRTSMRTIQRATYDGRGRTQIIATRYSGTTINGITLDRITRYGHQSFMC